MNKTLTIFCNYDAEPKISPYVATYVKELARHSEKVILVTNERELPKEELKKVSGKNIKVSKIANLGYDFGMWIRTLKSTDISNYDTFILANDSCILFRQLDDTINHYIKSNCDYYGLVSSPEKKWHIQSYFLILNRKCIDELLKYAELHELKNDYEYIVDVFEIGFAQHVLKQNLKVGMRYNYRLLGVKEHPSYFAINKLLDLGIPMIKRALISSKYGRKMKEYLAIDNIIIKSNFLHTQLDSLPTIKTDVEQLLLEEQEYRMKSIERNYFKDPEVNGTPSYGLTISTCMRIGLNMPMRLMIFGKMIESILNSNFEGPIIIIDDASDTYEHLDGISLDDRVIIKKLPKSSGISIVKNIGIKMLHDAGCEFFFVVDDDIEIFDPDFHLYYIEAFQKTGLHHITGNFSSVRTSTKINDFEIDLLNRVNRHFLFTTRTAIDTLGYFKVLPTNYGGEHVEFSRRFKTYHPNLCNDFYDLKESTKLLNHQPSPRSSSHGEIALSDDITKNLLAIKITNKYEPYKDSR